MIETRPLEPWTMATRSAVVTIAHDLADDDHAELMGLRPTWHTPGHIVDDVAKIIQARILIEGLVAFDLRSGEAVPFAVAMAFQTAMPKVASLAMFGRKGHGRAVVELYRELAARKDGFGAKHNLAIAQVPILDTHHAAIRKARALGGTPALDYGPIGTHGQAYTQHIWRLS